MFLFWKIGKVACSSATYSKSKQTFLGADQVVDKIEYSEKSEKSGKVPSKMASDDIFLTPQLRTGPTSRLLKRRSQLPAASTQKLEVTKFADTMDVTTFGQKDLTFHVMRSFFSPKESSKKLCVTLLGKSDGECNASCTKRFHV